MRKSFNRMCAMLLSVGMMMSFLSAFSLPVQAETTGTKAAPYDVWVQNAADRAFASSAKPPHALTKGEIYTAKNEYEAIQILVKSQQELKNVSITAGNLTSENGTVFPASNISLFREQSAPSAISGGFEVTPSGDDLYTDALLPIEVHDIPANETQPYWIRYYTSENQEAGVYSGSVTITSDAGNTEVPVTIKVYDVTLPKTNQSNFKMLNWFGSAGCDYGLLEASVPMQYGVTMYDDNWWKVMENFAKDLALHRNNVIFIDFQALLLPDTKINADGTYVFDWAKFDRMMDIFINEGALQYVYSPGSYLNYKDGIMNLCMIGQENGKTIRTFVPVYLDQEAQTINPKAEEYIKILFTAFYDHMNTRYPQYVDKFYISAQDEPAQAIQIAAANWFYAEVRKYYPTARSNEAHHKFVDNLKESTTLCPLLTVYETNKAFFDAQKQEGKEIWFYTTNGVQGEYLNRFIPQHLVKTRLIPWYAYKADVDGFLHWGYNYWTNSDTFHSKHSGDEWLVRPDKKNYDVFTSVRNEAQLDGLEDYELLVMLENISPDAAKSVVSDIIQSATKYTKSGETVSSAHRTILDAIVNGGTAAPVGVPVFEETFSTGYDIAWKRYVGKWAVLDGTYQSLGGEAFSTIRSLSMVDGEISFDVKFNSNAKEAWGGIDVRRSGSSMWNGGGEKVIVYQNGNVEFLNGPKSTYTASESGWASFTLKMQGDTLALYNTGSDQPLVTKTGCKTDKSEIALCASGAGVVFDNVKIKSYEGAKELPDFTPIKDISFREYFNDAALHNWEIVSGSAAVVNGKLETAASGDSAMGLKQRVFSDFSMTFDLTLDAGDYWAGAGIGIPRCDGTVMVDGGILLTLSPDGIVQLRSASKCEAEAKTGKNLAKTTSVRLDKKENQVKVYLDGEAEPVLTAKHLDLSEGFITLNAGGGKAAFDNVQISGLPKYEEMAVIDDFSGDLSLWKKVIEPNAAAIDNGALTLTGIKNGRGISPDMVLKDREFTNGVFSVDVKIEKVVNSGNWGGIYLRSSGQNGFWSSGGYLLYLTDQGRLVLYKPNTGDLQAAETGVDPTEDYVNLVIVTEGANIKVYVNNSENPSIDATDREFRSGYFGLIADHSVAHYDNIKFFLPEVLVDDFSVQSDRWTTNQGNLVCVKDGVMTVDASQEEGTVTSLLNKKVIENGDISFKLKLDSANGAAGCDIKTENYFGFEEGGGYRLTYGADGTLTLSSESKQLASVSTGILPIKDFVKVKLCFNGDNIKVFLNDAQTPVMDVTDSSHLEGYFFLTAQNAVASFDDVYGKNLKDEESSVDFPTENVDFEDDFTSQAKENWQNANTSYGSMEVQEDQLKLNGTHGAHAVIASLKGLIYSDAVIEFDMAMNTSNVWSGISIGRSKWDDTIWKGGYYLYYANTGLIKLDKAGRGPLAQAEITPAGNGPVHVKVVVSGNRIVVYASATDTELKTPIIDVTDPDVSEISGYLGLIAYLTPAQFDNFSVHPLATASALRDLETELAEAKKRNLDLYTPDTFQNLILAIEKAEDLLNNEFATGKAAAESREALKLAIANLKPATPGDEQMRIVEIPMTDEAVKAELLAEVKKVIADVGDRIRYCAFQVQKLEDGTWQDQQDLAVTIRVPYPEGSDMDANFAIVHKKSDSKFEICQYVKTPQGLEISAEGGGAFAIGWSLYATEHRFWENVYLSIRDAAPGVKISVDARDYEKMPVNIMEALGEKEDVTLIVRWNGGKDIVIHSSEALKTEPGRESYPLSLLEELNLNNTTTDPTKPSEHHDKEDVPQTGEVLPLGAMVLTLTSAMGMAGVSFYKKKK